MAKQKTKRGARKRFKIKKSGLIVRSRAGRRHNLSSKTRKRKRRLRKPAKISKPDLRRIKLLV